MNLKRLVITLYAAIMLFAVIGCDKVFAADLNVEKGEKYNTHMLNDQETVVIFNNQEIIQKQEMDMNCSINILDVDKNKNVTISYGYNSMKITVDTAGKKITYDSKQDDNNNPLSAIYSGILGKSVTIKLDNEGKLLEVKGLDDIIASTINNTPGSEQQKQALKNLLKQSFSDEGIKSMFQQAMKNYPPVNIKVGDVWERKSELAVIFPMIITSKYKLLSEKDGLLNIDIQSIFNADTQNNAVDIMGVKANIALNGEMNGNITVNKKNPFLQNMTIIQNISGEMEFETGKETPQTIKFPLRITSKIICETTKNKD